LEPFGKYQLILVIKKIHPSLAETPQFRQMFEDEAKVAVNLASMWKGSTSCVCSARTGASSRDALRSGALGHSDTR
jgi:hypothetical protein